MEKRSGVKEILLLIVALAVFIAALFGIYRLPQIVTTSLFVLETVLFLVLLIMIAGKPEKVDAPAEAVENPAPSEQSAPVTEAPAQPVSITVVSAPEDAAVGTDSTPEESASGATVVEVETVREVTKLKTVLFNEELLEEKDTVDMGEVVRNTLDVMEPFALAAGIRTGFVCAGNVTYTGSRQLLTVMMKNIVDNAVKYMRRAGNLHITVSNVADDIFIVCKDDGLGIGKDELPYIFDLNFQGSNRVSGNGLGLTQARDIVNAYGGTIYAKSAPGAGMGIYIQLPGNSGKSEPEA
ncbi:MAG: hypothetical protein IK138_03875 [Lachnospiraceae bacterium]|nr:hypothetical protein [Lachnospiraceae bacterium]